MNKDSYGITYYQDITFVSSVPLLFLFPFFSSTYSTWYSQVASHPSTTQAHPCLASDIRRHQVWSSFKS